MLKSQRGLTLIELLIVVAMISIFSSMAVVKINDAVAINDLNCAADRLAINIRTMQQLSLQKSRTNNMNINLTITPDTYQINSPGITLPVVTMPHNITMAITEKGPLTYDPYNATQNKGNMITLTNERSHQSKTIVICQETGRIRIDSANPVVYRPGEK